MKKNSLKKKNDFYRLIFFEKILSYINYILLAILFTSYLAKYINPEKWIIPALAEKIYPLIIFLILLFTIFWLLRFKKTALHNILIIIIGINTHINFYKINNNKEVVKAKIKITTFNVRQFNKYQWIKTKNITSEIVNFIQSTKSDILCLQEFHESSNLNKITFNNKHVNSNFKSKNGGLVIASNFPFLTKSFITTSKEPYKESIYADIVIHKDTFRIYNIHLTTSNNENLENIKKLTKNPINKKKEIIKNIKILTPMLKKSFKERNKEIDIIIKHIKSSPYKCIIAGDFNDTPNSYSVTKMSKILKDAFLESGSKTGKTYRNLAIPLRIDYIFIDKQFTSIKLKTHNEVSLSDHYPISADLIY